MVVCPAEQLLANRRRRGRLADFSRQFARTPTIFMRSGIAGAETRSIDRTENHARWLIEFASWPGAPAAAPYFQIESFDAAESDGRVSRVAR